MASRRPTRCRRRWQLTTRSSVEAVESHGGVVLKARGEGDSTFSVFARASEAVRAAYGAQVALSGYAWPEGAHLRVRVAVHSGEAVERDGDYVGTTVNRAARFELWPKAER